TRQMRRLNDLIDAFTSEAGEINAAKQVLIRRVAMLTLQLEMLESAISNNEGGEASRAQLLLYDRVASSLRRHLEALGLEQAAVSTSPEPARIVLRAFELECVCGMSWEGAERAALAEDRASITRTPTSADAPPAGFDSWDRALGLIGDDEERLARRPVNSH